MTHPFRRQASVTALMACLAIGAPGLSRADDPTPNPPRVAVIADKSGGADGLVNASVDIAAPPAVVWAVMTDCSRVRQLMVNVESCRVVDHDPAGRWDVREQTTRGGLLPGVRAVMRSDYDFPRLIRFHRIDGDFKVLDGSWRLEPLDGGLATRVVYESRMSAPFKAPAFLTRAVLRHDLPRTLNNLRAASEAEARSAPRVARAAEAGRP